jgi:hypothetical protein
VIAGAIMLVMLISPECRPAAFPFAAPPMGFENHSLFALARVLPPVGAKIISASTAES